MPSEPFRSASSPCSLIPCCLAKSSCFNLSCVAKSSSPIFFFSSEITSSRNVRWSRKNRMLEASVTETVVPTLFSEKSDASEPSVARLTRSRRDSRPRLSGRAKLGRLRCCRPHVRRKNLLRQSHRPRRSLDRRQKNFLLHPRYIEREQTP